LEEDRSTNGNQIRKKKGGGSGLYCKKVSLKRTEVKKGNRGEK